MKHLLGVEERNRRQRDYRRRNGNVHTKVYEKSPNGFLMRAYRNAQSRVTGVLKDKAHLYAGLPLMAREEFYEWARNDAAFWRLYRTWVQLGYPHKLSPSLNRINPDMGYVRGNVEWLTHSVNSSLARRPGKEALVQAIKRALNVA